MNDLTAACDRLDAAIAADTLTRRRWTAEEQGRHLACLLAAMVPKCGERETSDACPATVIPEWLAHLTPWIDDAGSQDRWPGVVREYACLLRASVALSSEQCQRLDFACRAVAVREERDQISKNAQIGKKAQRIAAIDAVLELLDHASAGGMVSDQEWVAARAAAPAEAWEAVRPAAAAAAASSSSTMAAKRAAADVASAAMRASADVASAADVADVERASEMASEMASDRMIDGIFTAWRTVIRETVNSSARQ